MFIQSLRAAGASLCLDLLAGTPGLHFDPAPTSGRVASRRFSESVAGGCTSPTVKASLPEADAYKKSMRRVRKNLVSVKNLDMYSNSAGDLIEMHGTKTRDLQTNSKYVAPKP